MIRPTGDDAAWQRGLGVAEWRRGGRKAGGVPAGWFGRAAVGGRAEIWKRVCDGRRRCGGRIGRFWTLFYPSGRGKGEGLEGNRCRWGANGVAFCIGGMTAVRRGGGWRAGRRGWKCAGGALAAFWRGRCGRAWCWMGASEGGERGWASDCNLCDDMRMSRWGLRVRLGEERQWRGMDSG